MLRFRRERVALARAAMPVVEGLEDRRLLSAVASSAAVHRGVLNVHGTGGDDTITVGINPSNAKQLLIRLNDRSFTFNRHRVKRIQISGRGGADFLGIDPTQGALGVSAVLTGGKGNDTLAGGGRNDVLHGDGGRNVLVGAGRMKANRQSNMFRHATAAPIQMPWEQPSTSLMSNAQPATTAAANDAPAAMALDDALTGVTLSGDGPFLVRADAAGTSAEFLQNGTEAHAPVALSSLGAITVNAGGGDDRLTLDFSGLNIIPGGISFGGGAGNNVLEIVGREGIGTVNLEGGAIALDCNDVYATDGLSFKVDAGTFTLNRSQQMESLDVESGASAVVAGGGGKVLVTRALTIAGSAGAWTGALDLNDNDLVIDYSGTSPVGTVISQLASGFNGALWTGTGIRSSAAASAGAQGLTALGEAEASALGLATFAGLPVDSSAIVVRYTYYGDATLNLKHDADDYALLDRGFARGLSGWINGNTNYDSSIDSTDYTRHNRVAALVGTPPTGATSIDKGQTYTLTLPTRGPVGAITGWQIDWGDGSPVDNIGAQPSYTHTYTTGAMLRGIVATAIGTGGTFSYVPVRVAVEGITFYSPTTAEIDLDWTASAASDVHAYTVYRSTDPNFTPSEDTLLNIADSPSYEDIGLSAATTYYYVVNELHDDGTETPVDPASATTRASDPANPESPTNVQVTQVNDLEMQMTWTPPSKKVRGFLIEESTDNVNWTLVHTDDPTLPSVSRTANAWTFRNRQYGVPYYYRITSLNGRGNSPYVVSGPNFMSTQGYQSMVIVVGGHFQEMEDLDRDAGNSNLDTGFSVGGIAKRLRHDDYNVFLFAEYHNENIDQNGTGIALDEAEREIIDRGITQITLIGYSHGAGVLSDLASRLKDDIPLGRPYQISYVTYIDAVQRGFIDDFIFASPEHSTPVGMVAGVNFYEPHGDFGARGNSVNGMTNILVTQTDDGKWIKHTNIVQQRRQVWDQVEQRVKTNMPQQ